MTVNAMKNPDAKSETPDPKIDASLRVPLLALFGGAALWLVVGDQSRMGRAATCVESVSDAFCRGSTCLRRSVTTASPTPASSRDSLARSKSALAINANQGASDVAPSAAGETQRPRRCRRALSKKRSATSSRAN